MWKIGRDRLQDNPQPKYTPWIVDSKDTPAQDEASTQDETLDDHDAPPVKHHGPAQEDPVKWIPRERKVESRIFTFKPSTLQLIHTFLQEESPTTVLSIWDTIVALLWTTLVNLPGQEDISAKTRFLYPVNIRRRLGGPPEFIGSCVILATAEALISDLLVRDWPIFLGKDPQKWSQEVKAALVKAGKACRTANTNLNPHDSIAFAAGIQDLTKVKLDVDLTGGRDFYMVSHVHIGADIEWNIKGTPGGKAEFVRRPGCSKQMRYCMIMPRRGGFDMVDEDVPVEVFVQLDENEMSMLCEEGSGWENLVEKWIE